jgi:hypothetical protein
MPQMQGKVLIVVVLAIALFAAYSYFFRKSESFAVEIPAPAPVIEQPPPHLPGRVITPAGPNSPAQQADLDEPPALLPEPKDRDPYGDSYQSSSFGDESRNPEKLFGPAPLPTVTDIAQASGVASSQLSPFQPAVEQFNPETAQNGGAWIKTGDESGIFAFDKDMPTNYASF